MKYILEHYVWTDRPKSEELPQEWLEAKMNSGDHLAFGRRTVMKYLCITSGSVISNNTILVIFNEVQLTDNSEFRARLVRRTR